jgi:DNA-binding NarL/FixJ family response regulator
VITTPAYVHDLLDSLVTGAPLNFRGHPVPDDVQTRLLSGRLHRLPTAPVQPNPAPAPTGAAPPLAKSEHAVLRGMAEGTSNRAIGEALFIAEDTVKTHARRLFRKLGARDRAHAVALGFRAGILK